MQVFTLETVERCPVFQVATPQVLGTSIVLNLEEFPELNWLSAYLTTLNTLQSECDRLCHSIQTIAAEGDVYRNCWIEPYTKIKNEKKYTYYQLRRLTGERKKSGQPKVKTKHLSHRAVGEVRAAIARGEQIAALEKQQEQMKVQLSRLKQIVWGTDRRLERMGFQNLMTNQSINQFIKGCL
ncbi:hypothetical protein JOY44_26055 (plasmid) [Phormidium sp. CLA17]|uniref:hypothetical protein n=1 Tax=Leptolyngbya sp. Cla-17 TaxID=2803751 RepID=UPI001492B882|nr:hypothetical protein [Leptolyngbya sp. Cla-17]MBM0744986.1 hypothetical protein [Leptolyngbya sp. Cla-17]